MTMIFKRGIALSLFLLTTFFSFSNDISINSRGLSANEIDEAKQKAMKVMSELSINNDSIYSNVLIVIANRYLELREIHQQYDLRNQAIENTDLAKNNKEIELERSYFQYNSDLYRSRFGYIAWLSFYLDVSQVETVKNAMTYHMLQERFDGFLTMLPDMAKEDQIRVYNWLVEAREYSMDFETPRKMRQMFTKYRGRINNYLSKRGYQLN